MTWIYSSFAGRVNWSAEPQTAAVPARGGSARGSLLGRPRNSRCCSNKFYPGPVFSIPHLSPRSMLFSLFQKVTKINLKVSFFCNMNLTVRQLECRFVASSVFSQIHTVQG